MLSNRFVTVPLRVLRVSVEPYHTDGVVAVTHGGHTHAVSRASTEHDGDRADRFIMGSRTLGQK